MAGGLIGGGTGGGNARVGVSGITPAPTTGMPARSPTADATAAITRPDPISRPAPSDARPTCVAQ